MALFDHIPRPHDVALGINQEVLQGDRTDRMLNGNDRTMDVGDPGGDLVDIGDSGGQRHQRDIFGTVDNDLLPDRAPAFIPHIMAFVQDNVSQVFWRLQVKHIAQDFGGHDQDGGLRVHLDIAS